MRAPSLRLVPSFRDLSAENIALILAVGLVLGTFPVYGCATFLCVLASLVLRVNFPALQVVNQLCFPLQLALLMPLEPVPIVFPAIALVGAGIGACWAFIAQRVMSGARAGEEDLAASSVATVQQTGFALGAALAGLVANAAGLSSGLSRTDIAEAAFWVPTSFVAAAVAATIMGSRLARHWPAARD